MTTYQITRTVADVTTVIAQGLDAHDAAERLLSEAGAQYDVVEDCGDESEVVIETASGKEIWRDCEPGDEAAAILSLRLRRDGALYLAVAE